MQPFSETLRYLSEELYTFLFNTLAGFYDGEFFHVFVGWGIESLEGSCTLHMQKLEDLVEKVCYFLLTHGRLESCQAIDIVEAEGGFLLLCFLDKNKTLKFMVAENKFC